ncbi:MAG: hypothetical protein KUG61_00615 [Parvibaculaceae bacterium]|nr:hypothetical protein [Parvibaculaceae bacterium]
MFVVKLIEPITPEKAERWANALPLNPWTTDLAEVSGSLLEGLQYWQSLPAPLGCPEVDQFDLLEIASSLKDAFLSERQPDDGVNPLFQSYFMGPRFEQRLHIPSNQNQIFPLHDVSPALLQHARETSLLIDAWRAPLSGTGTWKNYKALDYLKYEALYLPLCNSEGIIFRIVALWDFGPDKNL